MIVYPRDLLPPIVVTMLAESKLIWHPKVTFLVNSNFDGHSNSDRVERESSIANGALFKLTGTFYIRSDQFA